MPQGQKVAGIQTKSRPDGTQEIRLSKGSEYRLTFS